MNGRRCQLDEVAIARILRDAMSHVDCSQRRTTRERKSIGVAVAQSVAQAECRAVMALLAERARVSAPASADPSEAAQELVEAIYTRIASGLLQDADDLALGDEPHVFAATVLRQHAALLVRKAKHASDTEDKTP